jgi:hypothetical protein
VEEGGGRREEVGEGRRREEMREEEGGRRENGETLIPNPFELGVASRELGGALLRFFVDFERTGV